LDIRFRYTEELLNKEKEKRRLTSVSKSTAPKAAELTREMMEKSPKSIVTSKRLRSFNRHAIPDEIKEVVAPQPVITDRKEPGDVPKPPHMRALPNDGSTKSKPILKSRTERTSPNKSASKA